MKYLCLVYLDEKRLPELPDEDCVAYDAAIRASGQCIASEALESVQTATTVRVRDGKVAVTDGPFAKRKMWSNVGLHSPKGPIWGQMGRSFIRAVLNSARNVQPQDNSPQAAAARRINSFADLDGIEFLARVDVEKDGKGEERNVVKIAIEPDHKDYVPLTGMSPTGGGHRGGGGHSGAPVQPTPAHAQPAPQARPVVPTGKPAWAQ